MDDIKQRLASAGVTFECMYVSMYVWQSCTHAYVHTNNVHTHILYGIMQFFGGGKYWRVWQAKQDVSKFLPPNVILILD